MSRNVTGSAPDRTTAEQDALRHFVYINNGWGTPKHGKRPEMGRLMDGTVELARGPWGLMQHKKKELEARGWYKRGALRVGY